MPFYCAYLSNHRGSKSKRFVFAETPEAGAEQVRILYQNMWKPDNPLECIEICGVDMYGRPILKPMLYIWRALGEGDG